MPGPKRLPTKLKVIRGTLDKRGFNKNELTAPVLDIAPNPPEYFNEYAKKEWQIICEYLDSVGILAKTDISLLTSYCYAVGMCREAEVNLSKQPKVGTQKNKAGEVYQFTNKWFNIWNMSSRQVISLAGEFGFSPSARTRISAPNQNNKNNQDKQMFGT